MTCVWGWLFCHATNRTPGQNAKYGFKLIFWLQILGLILIRLKKATSKQINNCSIVCGKLIDREFRNIFEHSEGYEYYSILLDALAVTHYS